MKNNKEVLRMKKTQYLKHDEWSKAVFERDNNRCQGCNKVRSRLYAHHIENFENAKEIYTTVDNGITFCKRCYDNFHHWYGWESDIDKVVTFMKEYNPTMRRKIC